MMKRILYVDDDVDLLNAMKMFLRRKGFEVEVSTSCKEGLEKLRTFHPDLILLDINVGDEDGRLMCRQIKQEANYAHIPVILVSGNNGALKTYREYGADHFIEKPFDLPDLIGTLNSFL
jgi:DNA-binding response OmpR family regulator